jgi:poly-gamma-glutamate synthesis protein (capsule biosynthesis protein)
MKSKKYAVLILILLSISFALFYFFKKKSSTIIEPAIISIIKKEIQIQEPISLLFVGDIMLDRTIRKDGEAYGYENLFSCLANEFSKYDEVIGNLEGTVTDFESRSRDAAYQSPESFSFTFDPLAVLALKEIGLSIVSLANNHIRDYGNEGISQTVSNLMNLEIDFFGDPRAEGRTYFIKDIKGTKIAFIGYNEFFGTKEETLEDLLKVKTSSDIQIIFSHWGNEYTEVRPDIKAFAHTLVDSGADLIIGAHPHVIQEVETYKEVAIYYSLGNFIFDQYWEEAVRDGLGVHIKIQDKKIAERENIYFESMRHKGTCLKKKTLAP